MTREEYIAKQFKVALQMFAKSITDESEMMKIADIYPKWNGNSKAYKIGDIISYGVNADGETQLYTVIQAHTSQANWTPDTAVSLYKKVGFTESGVSIWTQPLGATDAYAKGDTVEHNGKLWVSDIDGNVWEPGVYGWSEKA